MQTDDLMEIWVREEQRRIVRFLSRGALGLALSIFAGAVFGILAQDTTLGVAVFASGMFFLATSIFGVMVWRVRQANKVEGLSQDNMQLLAQPGGGSRTGNAQAKLLVDGDLSFEDDLGKLVALASNLPIMVVVSDLKGRILQWNDSAEQAFTPMLSPSRETVISDLVRHEDRNMLNTARAALAGAKAHLPKRIEVVMTTQQEGIGQLSFSTADVGGRRVIFWSFLDRTEHRSLQQQFVQAQKMQAVGQLAGGVAHDFNNLLTAILGFCDLLLSRHDPSDRSFSDLMQIKQNANRAANLVRQLLAFSRQQTMRPKAMTLSDALGDLGNLLRRLIGSSIELRVKHGRGIRRVLVDQGQLDQVIVNLAVNARDAMPDGGILTISTSMIEVADGDTQLPPVVLPGEYVEIRVKDSGAGIPAEILDKVFEPFFTTKAVGEGTGLGLATVYGIVKQMDGYIFAHSSPGEGAEFQILLKAYDEIAGADVADEPGETEAKDLSGTGTILVVEDEDPVRILVNRALSARGYSVLEAVNGDDGLEVFEANIDSIDLMITDVIMPGLDGPGLAEKVRRARVTLPVLFMSGYAESIVRKDLEDSKNYFLQKPFSLKDISIKVKQILSEKV